MDQYLSNRSPRSTVGTATEVFTYLRVLFARLGHRPCPTCGGDVPPSTEVGDDLFEEDESRPERRPPAWPARTAARACPNWA